MLLVVVLGCRDCDYTLDITVPFGRVHRLKSSWEISHIHQQVPHVDASPFRVPLLCNAVIPYEIDR